MANENKYNLNVKLIDTFIETNHKQLNFSKRDDVEKELFKFLSKYGIECHKLPDKVLFDKVWEKAIDTFTILIDQFINKLQQNYFDDINSVMLEVNENNVAAISLYKKNNFIVINKRNNYYGSDAALIMKRDV